MIPRRFHFVFGFRKQTRAFHLAHYLCLKSCLTVNAPDVIHFYFLHEPWGPYWDLIKPHLQLEKVSPNPFVESFRYDDPKLKPLRYAHHADFVRLEKLLEHGGVYADIDTLFVRPLPEKLYEQSFVMGRETGAWSAPEPDAETSLCNALMMAEPGAEFGRIWLERMEAAFDGTWSNHSTFLPQRLASEYPHLIHVEQASSFFHFGATPRDLFALFEDLQEIPPDVYSFHLWEHLWWDRERTDFSFFHSGKLNESYVRDGGSTYSNAARPFLPSEPPRASKIHEGLEERKERILEAMNDVRDDARALAGLALIPLVRKISPQFGHLNLARSRWAFSKALRAIKPANAFELSLLRWVIQWDEYNVFDQLLEPGDVVIDVGAHIGSFTFACHALGSRNIHSFEPSPANFHRLTQSVASLAGVHLYGSAVFRSDRALETLVHSGPYFANTGSGSVLFENCRIDHETGEAVALDPRHCERVPTVKLDEILCRFPRVRLLKLDCEGSEFPILLTSRHLAKVERIVGEYHQVPAELMHHLTPDATVEGFAAYDVDALRAALENAAFNVTCRAMNSTVGNFNAVRKS